MNTIKPLIFGSTGMIGQAVLLECIEDPLIETILIINRSSSGVKHQKVKEILLSDFSNFSALVKEFGNYNTCFFCLGISALGLSEEEYTKITYDLCMKAANTLLQSGTAYTFCYVSGAGTDSTEKGRQMWARVKGKLENALLALPFKNAFMFRPGYIQPMKGIVSRTKSYRIIYKIFTPLYYLLKPFKGAVTDTTTLGKAMISAARNGYDKKIIEMKDINLLGK
jgi:hypothetical protein